MVVLKNSKQLGRFLAVAAISLSQTISASSQTLSSDMVFKFECSKGLLLNNIAKVENFYRKNGFSYINNSDNSPVYNGRKLVPIGIYGTKNKSEIISITSEPMKNDVFIADIKSRPPTNHNKNLESALVNLFTNEIPCKIYDHAYYNNDASLRPMFDAFISMYNIDQPKANNNI